MNKYYKDNVIEIDEVTEVKEDTAGKVTEAVKEGLKITKKIKLEVYMRGLLVGALGATAIQSIITILVMME